MFHFDGPPKIHKPRVHCPPCPPLSEALHSIDRAMRIEQYSTWHGARVVCLGGTKTWVGGRLRSRNQTN